LPVFKKQSFGDERAIERKADMPIQTVVLLAAAGVFGLAVMLVLSAAFFMIYTSRLMVSRSPSRVRLRRKNVDGPTPSN
jgi:hypothetical protein